MVRITLTKKELQALQKGQVPESLKTKARKPRKKLKRKGRKITIINKKNKPQNVRVKNLKNYQKTGKINGRNLYAKKGKVRKLTIKRKIQTDKKIILTQPTVQAIQEEPDVKPKAYNLTISWYPKSMKKMKRITPIKGNIMFNAQDAETFTTTVQDERDVFTTYKLTFEKWLQQIAPEITKVLGFDVALELDEPSTFDAGTEELDVEVDETELTGSRQGLIYVFRGNEIIWQGFKVFDYEAII